MIENVTYTTATGPALIPITITLPSGIWALIFCLVLIGIMKLIIDYLESRSKIQ